MFYANDVNITENATIGSDRINSLDVVNSLKNSFSINNEIDWQIKCADYSGVNVIEWQDVLTLNDTTDLYLSFNNATVTINGLKSAEGLWIVNVNIYDIYDFDIESYADISSFKTAIGSVAGSYAALEQAPLIGAIKTYNINVNYTVYR